MCFSLRVASVLWLLRGRRSGRARFVRKSRQNALVPDGCSCGAGNQAQLTFVALVNPLAQETRIAKPSSRQHNHKDLGFPWDPRGFTGVRRNRGTRRSSGRGLLSEDAKPWDLVRSIYFLRALPASSNGEGFHTRQTNLSAPLACGVLRKTTFRPLGPSLIT